ncbi:MAG: threonine/serine exporter family protein [Oscillospiraceae bacterium]|nr:threonine/serine exporter family protein [Oscillospiraceae bacterium]
MPHRQNWESQKFLAREEAVLACILDLGEMLLTSGAEIKRVEDTVSRLCKVYSFVRVDVFTITSSIVLTVRTPGGRILSQTRRILTRDTDLGRVEKVNALSRQLCAAPASLRDFQREIARLRRDGTYPTWVQRLMYIAISAAFCLFFGGTTADGVAAAVSGLVLFQTLQMSKPLRLNGTLQCMMASFITGLAVVGLYWLGLGEHPDLISMGNIMLLIPGIAFTAALRDIINGDTLAGIISLCEAILRALAVAIGFAAMLTMTGG